LFLVSPDNRFTDRDSSTHVAWNSRGPYCCRFENWIGCVGSPSNPTEPIASLRRQFALSQRFLCAFLKFIEKRADDDGHVDYAQLFKVFASETNAGRGRYSPPEMVRSEKEVLIGDPDPEHVSTSFVERQNLSVRMECRRFTRLTNAFSKKLANLKASVALHYAHYNFVRIHRTLRMTPAMAAGVSNRLWSVEELIAEAAGIARA
jgi:hypothetical protein